MKHEAEASNSITHMKYYRIWATHYILAEKNYITTESCPIHYYSCSGMSAKALVNYEIGEVTSARTLFLHLCYMFCQERDGSSSERFDGHGLCCC